MFRELCDELSIVLNNPMGMNMRIDYSKLEEKTLDELEEYVIKYNKWVEEMKK
ncbi:hypothetical protein [Cetobacterium somerae]|uniref:hypothetical protein n=1 Tax=Cetobacterium somerae TaxID=188913 RepID=UPI00248DCA95|nr:hypothetical protein [Cetobacterium somerae]